MSNVITIDHELIHPIKEWLEDNQSQRLDEMANAYDEDDDVPLRGESIEVQIQHLIDRIDDEYIDELPEADYGPKIEATIEAAVVDLLHDRGLEEVDDPMEDGWCIELVDPTDEMYIDISSPKSRYTGQLVAIKGRVRKKTDPIPWFRTREYTCKRCFTEQDYERVHEPEHIVRGITHIPHSCYNELCKAGVGDMETLPKKSEERDYQYITVEQAPGADGSTPAKIPCWVFNEARLTSASEGERVTVVGRLRLNPDSDPAEHYVEVSSIISEREDSTVELTDEDRETVRGLVDSMENPLNVAANNLAPRVHGRDLAKRALALVAVGGGIDDASEQTHTMLIGDPSTGKTELTAALREVVPSTRKASLTQSSSVGLTASAVKEEVAGSEEWVIRAGAITLASGGILTIDELDEADFDLSKLNDALSEGDIPVDKAGKSTRVKTDTRVIATANPADAEFDPMEPLGDQIQFSADVVSRFDLVIPFIDDSDDQEMNEGIMNAVAADYLDGEEMEDEYEQYSRSIKLEQMRKWIASAQQQEPTMTTEALEEVRRGWTIMREADDGAININARRLRSIIRLSRAHARLRLADEVKERDANVAFGVVSEMLGEWGYDISGAVQPVDQDLGEELAEPADD